MHMNGEFSLNGHVIMCDSPRGVNFKGMKRDLGEAATLHSWSCMMEIRNMELCRLSQEKNMLVKSVTPRVSTRALAPYAWTMVF
jgi:hypothetical protein